MKPKKYKKELTEAEKFCLDAYMVNGNADLAYSLSRKNEPKATEDNLHRLALRWLRSEQVVDYLNERKMINFASKQSPAIGKFREKDAVLEALEAELPNLKGKEKTDVLMKIADLQQMKREDPRIEHERVHFYIPATNIKCPFCQKKIILEQGTQ